MTGGQQGRPGAATRVAALDCGTNSLRLLVADVEPGGPGAAGRLRDVVRTLEIVRLGQGVDRAGSLAPEALGRTLQVLRRYAEIIAASGAVAVRMVATSATRDAANAEDFVSGVHAILGIEPEVITGDQEAALSFAGATAELAERRPARQFLVADIGGGSTEFVLGSAAPGAGGDLGGGVAGSVSVDIGCVRMTERHLRSDPPTVGEIAAASRDVDAALDMVELKVPGAGAASLVGLAGSVTTVAGIALGLSAYDAARLHHARIPAGEVHSVASRLLASSHRERAAMAVMHPGRVDVIGGGALILDRVMTRFGFGDVLVSEHDILDGLARSLASPARQGRPAGPVP